MASSALGCTGPFCAQQIGLIRDPVVNILQSKLVGFSQNVDGRPLDFFLGVRYAKPPIGSLRFARPQKLDPWNGTVMAKQYGSSCLQNIPVGDYAEDCLFLNVIRPSGYTASSKLPVLLFVHGYVLEKLQDRNFVFMSSVLTAQVSDSGSFQFGSGKDNNGSRIVAESMHAGSPVIWISINYRLGAFGFLGGSSMLSAAKAGTAVLNAGMFDTRMALKWVQRNIAAFGGDPTRVTLMGQSSGAFITGNMLLARRGNNHNLFHAAIMQSGSPGSASTLPPDHPRLDQTFVDISIALGCPPAPSDVSCLKSISSSALAAAANNVTQFFWVQPQTGLLPYMPVQDFQVDGFFFPSAPHLLVSRGQFADVPVLSGCDYDEGTKGAPQNLNTSADFAQWLRAVAIPVANSTRVDRVVAQILKIFPDDVTFGAPYYREPTRVSAGTTNITDPYYAPATNQFKRAAAFYGAWRYEAPHRKFLLKKAAAGQRGIWSYRFAQQDLDGSAAEGVGHSSELAYIFGNTTEHSSVNLYSPLSKLMQRAWISFATHKDPRMLDNLHWPEFTGEHRAMIQFQGMATRIVKEDFREDQLAYIKSKEAAAVLSS
ncbi:hypothetical protein A4X09_0g2963 [Tilletia walkeri]|uniref:Carboxylic ester hydrolase n=1 Tax=Tilletia walkeri TaxID=117179 RepID=A0A8X7T6J7_9BASI|nr:hypothetical protein A4X09_0g2963 [Tilletia walkeri]